jgi:hypothetical protein
MQYFGKRKADEGGPGGNDQAKSNRVGVDGTGPAALVAVPDLILFRIARSATRPRIPNMVATKGGGMGRPKLSFDFSTS